MQQLFHIGIPKSGTTTIQSTLENDPRLYVTRSRYFTSKDWWLTKQEDFPDDRIIVESNETMISGGFQKAKLSLVVERMFRTNPKAHIVVTIRDQQKALLSMYKYHIKRNFEGTHTFQHWLYDTNLGMDYLSLCMYGNIAKLLLAYFPKEQLHFLCFEALRETPKLFYQQFYSAMGISFQAEYMSSEAKNVMQYSDDQLYTLARWNRFSIAKNDASSPLGSKSFHRTEQRIKKGLVRRFSRKCPELFFDLDTVEGYSELKEEFRNTNKTLVDLGLADSSQLEQYGYLQY